MDDANRQKWRMLMEAILAGNNGTLTGNDGTLAGH